MKTVHLIAGARPNFVKIAALYHAFKKDGQINPAIVHTGQHYDFNMSGVFFDELEIPQPEIYLNTNGRTHAEQTGRIMMAYEVELMKNYADIVLVVGDVNSTVACALTAKKLGIKVAHIEAGLRSRDLLMPEEINRIVTDSISDYLFVTEKSGVENLRLEGRNDKDIFLVGNVMIDTLFKQLVKLNGDKPKNPFVVATLHRPSSVDDRYIIKGIIEALRKISHDMPVILPVHPRTEKNISRWGFVTEGISFVPPKSYMDFLQLWRNASLVITDSGGLQEETTAIGVPCFTVRENTERPITVDIGTNTLVGTNKEGILSAYDDFKKNGPKVGTIPELWDGKAASRIVDKVGDLI